VLNDDRKSSYAALKSTIDAVEAGKVNCAQFTASHLGAVQPIADALVERIEWPSLAAFSAFNEVWSFDVDTRADATFSAAIIQVDRTANRPGKAALKAGGSLTRERPRTVTFPARSLPPGTYRVTALDRADARSGRPHGHSYQPGLQSGKLAFPAGPEVVARLLSDTTRMTELTGANGSRTSFGAAG
jgi:hypothetical protein